MTHRIGHLLRSALKEGDQAEAVILGFPSTTDAHGGEKTCLGRRSKKSTARWNRRVWSFDLDALSQTEAPGVSAPNASGINTIRFSIGMADRPAGGAHGVEGVTATYRPILAPHPCAWGTGNAL